MTRRVSKSGRVYTEGSHGGWDGYPRECSAGCGKPLRITRDLVWQETTADGVKRSWHFECRKFHDK